MRVTRTKASIALAAALVVGLVAATAAAAPGPPDKKKGGGGKPAGGGDVAASLTFLDAENDVSSDSLGAYSDGVARVQAFFGATRGGFRLDTARSARAVNVDFFDAGDDGDCALGFGYPCSRPLLVTGQADPVLVGDVDLRIGNPGQSLNLLELQGVGAATLEVHLQLGRKDHIYLHYGPSDMATCDFGSTNSPAEVTRVNDTTWAVQADVASVMEVVGNDWSNPVCRGFVHMPVTFTIVSQ